MISVWQAEARSIRRRRTYQLQYLVWILQVSLLPTVAMVPFRSTTAPTTVSRPETISPHRPPQYKIENCGCGYRCGWGCEEPLQESVSDGVECDIETDSTVVGSPSEPTSQEEGYVESEGVGWQGTATVPEEYDESLSHVNQWEGSIRQTISQDYDSMPGSLEPEPYATQDHSPMTSNSGSGGSVSPYPDFEYVTRGLPVVQLPPTYLFLELPLWLSPRDEHCHGV
ncbi:hypothetical protein IQ07DRAFT_583276 [Pyrenochaeta sp. DS3sAY3a]|nr:hypothetical protein IQ07DRAFT_583276 [Pyrenochaeta sp. DS3sAY3a]